MQNSTQTTTLKAGDNVIDKSGFSGTIKEIYTWTTGLCEVRFSSGSAVRELSDLRRA